MKIELNEDELKLVVKSLKHNAYLSREYGNYREWVVCDSLEERIRTAIEAEPFLHGKIVLEDGR